jgi:hypothetical protein
MRYIKVFEEFGNEKFFKKIEWSEWIEKVYDLEYVKISNIEKDWIVDKLKPFQPKLVWDVPNRHPINGEILKISFTSNEPLSIYGYQGIIPTEDIVIELSKLSDDWFMVYFRRVFSGSNEFYICDQFEGLKQFFKEKLGL